MKLILCKMEQSFELLSSMSPKVVMKKKPLKKGTSVLALKKNIRRSSIYGKTGPILPNHPPDFVEVLSSTESMTNSEDSSSEPKRLNAKTIIIEDSDNEEDFKEKVAENDFQNTPLSTLPKSKFDEILKWIDNVDPQGDCDKSAFSEVSTIIGDNLYSKFFPKEKGSAVNSTLVGSTGKRFDEMFIAKRKPMTNLSSYTDGEAYRSAKNIIIEDSFEDKRPVVEQSNKVVKAVIDDSFEENNRQVPESYKKSVKPLSSEVEETSRISDSQKQKDRSNSKKLTNNPKSTKSGNQQNGLLKDSLKYNSSVKQDTLVDDEVESMLDSLYGDQWRKKQHLVLPNSEPRKNNIVRTNNMPNTEKRPKTSTLYKNPYLDREFKSPASFSQKTQMPRSTAKETPTLARLRALCDPDTDTSESPEKCRQKLDFSDDNSNESREDTKSKYFNKKTDSSSESSLKSDKSNKENIETSKLSVSLEEKIKKKINKIKDIPSTKKKKPVKTEKKKEADQEKKKTVARKKTATKPNSNKYRKPKVGTRSLSSDESDTGNKKKTGRSKTKKVSSSESSSIGISSDDDEKFDRKIEKIHRSSLAHGTYSFLESLSGDIPILQCDMAARIFRNNFSSYKDELYRRLFDLYNERIFGNAIPADTERQWSDKLRGTAGFCVCKKITRRNGAVERKVRIVLSTKVIDSAYRMRDTLVHEMCHAATWIVNGMSDGHGSYWKAWAYKAMKTFPELPPIKRCHDYVINTKYTYRCTQCGYSFGRHSKSLDLTRKRCGHCYGTFEVLINRTTKNGEVKAVPSTPKQATGFALFVKEYYGVYKNPARKHGDVMKLLGQKFQELKMKN